MKIAMFSDNFYPELSGISDSVAMTAREMGVLGHAVTIYAPRYSRKNFLKGNVPVAEIDLGPNVRVRRFFSISFPAPTQQGRFVFPTFLRWLWMLWDRPDIIHTHLFFGVGLEALAASKVLGVPLVGTSHTPILEFVQYSPIRSAWLDRVAPRLVSWYYNQCERISAPSQGILDDMYRCGFHRPSEVISNPIDVHNFQPASVEEAQSLKSAFGFSQSTVLYTGRLAPEKHIDVLIRAIAVAQQEIADICLVITGHGESEDALRELAEELGIGARVKFLGTLKQEDHIRAYQGADVFAIASTAETQSLSLMKAMAVEIPVIGARARALPEYIHEDNGFLVDPGDVAGFAEKIVWLFRHPEQRKRFGIEGRKLAERFLPEQIALRWVDFYEQVCSQGALRRVTTPAVFRRWYRRFILRDFVREGIEKK